MTKGARAKIITTYVYPPIPDRRFDWCAYYEDEPEGNYGWGKTEKEARDELLDNYEILYEEDGE